jgi:hypothetical protein
MSACISTQNWWRTILSFGVKACTICNLYGLMTSRLRRARRRFSGAAAADDWLGTWIFVGSLWKLLCFYRHPHLIHGAAICSSFYTQNQSHRTDCTNGRCSSEMVVSYENEYAFCWSRAIMPH